MLNLFVLYSILGFYLFSSNTKDEVSENKRNDILVLKLFEITRDYCRAELFTGTAE